ncbi:MAG: hypothetical protein AAF500_12500 [Myxococcota bacterium]
MAGSALPAAPASGQALYYRSIPVGERAVGLGGAFTGLATDPSATYYNPAGMTTGGRFELLGSFSSLLFSQTKIEDAFVSPNAQATFAKRTTSTLPRFIGTVVRLGRAKHGRDHQFAIGYSTLEVARENFGDGFTEISEANSTDIRINNRFRDRWYGVSFAGQVTRRSSVGFTLFLSDQSLNYTENVGLAAGGDLDAETAVRVGGQSVTSSSDVGASAYSFVVRLGWLHDINKRWNIGVMFQPPGIPLSRSGRFLRQVASTFPGDEGFFLLYDENGKARLPIPFQLTGGFAFQINDTSVLTVDVSVTGPVKTGRLIQIDPPESIRRLGVFLGPSTGRRAVPNVSVGAEHRFKRVVLAGGLFTNISASPNVPETSTQYAADQVNLYGASVSFGLDTKGFRFTVGSTFMYGVGDALSATINENTEVLGYQRTRARRGILLLYVAGAIAVATKTGKLVTEKYQERQQQKEEEGVTPPPENTNPSE